VAACLALIIFGHNVVILVPVFIYYRDGIDASALLSLAGILLVAVNGFTVGIALGIVCARFRDVPPIESLIRRFCSRMLRLEHGHSLSELKITSQNN
jgi:ABC-type polysaccharide/polyol phosphate export permease